MVICHNFFGGLGNTIQQITSSFLFCMYNDLSYDNIVFSNQYYSGHKSDYTSNYMFKNILKYFKDPKYVKSIEKPQYPKINLGYTSDCTMEELCKCCYQLYIKYQNNIVLLDSLCGTKYIGILYDILDLNSIILDIRNKFINLLPEKYDCIHIRRGDFITYNKKVYSENDICSIIESTTNKVVLLTNDLKWCKEITSKYGNKIIYLEGTVPYEDMIIGILSKNLYGRTNSSFYRCMCEFKKFLN